MMTLWISGLGFTFCGLACTLPFSWTRGRIFAFAWSVGVLGLIASSTIRLMAQSVLIDAWALAIGAGLGAAIGMKYARSRITRTSEQPQ